MKIGKKRTQLVLIPYLEEPVALEGEAVVIYLAQRNNCHCIAERSCEVLSLVTEDGLCE